MIDPEHCLLTSHIAVVEEVPSLLTYVKVQIQEQLIDFSKHKSIRLKIYLRESTKVSISKVLNK